MVDKPFGDYKGLHEIAVQREGCRYSQRIEMI